MEAAGVGQPFVNAEAGGQTIEIGLVPSQHLATGLLTS